MSNIIAVVEGVTEQTFIREVLAPWLWDRKQVHLRASAAGKPGHKGGNVYGKARRDIINHLKNAHFNVVTTFFDFYGMSGKWPGRGDAAKRQHEQRAQTVEQAILEDIREDVDEDQIGRLVPYVQMHEFEALLFSDTSALPIVMRKESLTEEMNEIAQEFHSPEHINDSPNTAPSKRILKLFPYYQKPLHGVLTAKRITIEVMTEHCPHFKEWVDSLERACD